jgi:hypothetical protein
VRDITQARIDAWNRQPHHIRKARLGANMFEAHQKLPFALPKGHRLHEDGTIGPRAKRPPPAFVTKAAESRAHAGAARPLRQRSKPPSFDPTTPVRAALRYARKGMDQQIKEENIRDMTYAYQGGAGGTKMSWDEASRRARRDYAAGKRPKKRG